MASLFLTQTNPDPSGDGGAQTRRKQDSPERQCWFDSSARRPGNERNRPRVLNAHGDCHPSSPLVSQRNPSLSQETPEALLVNEYDYMGAIIALSHSAQLSIWVSRKLCYEIVSQPHFPIFPGTDTRYYIWPLKSAIMIYPPKPHSPHRGQFTESMTLYVNASEHDTMIVDSNVGETIDGVYEKLQQEGTHSDIV